MMSMGWRSKIGIAMVAASLALAGGGCGDKEPEQPAEPEGPTAEQLEAERRQEASAALGSRLTELAGSVPALDDAGDASAIVPTALEEQVAQAQQALAAAKSKLAELEQAGGEQWESARASLESELTQLQQQASAATAALDEWRQREREAASGEREMRVDPETGLIEGLDGGEYDPYLASKIEHVQRHLRRRGLYAGPVDGYLDLRTMEAIGRFQAAHNLQVSGVPSPRTRALLLEHPS